MVGRGRVDPRRFRGIVMVFTQDPLDREASRGLIPPRGEILFLFSFDHLPNNQPPPHLVIQFVQEIVFFFPSWPSEAGSSGFFFP